jgi:vesicle coat complex subunit
VFEPSLQVQLQLLTAIVKLFLKRPTDTQELVQQVLSLATQVRSFFYNYNNKIGKKEERI